MSPLRLFGPLTAARLSSRRICAGSAAHLVHHQSRNLADDARRSGRFFSARRGSTVAAVTLSSALVGATLYFRQDAEKQPAADRKRPDLPTPTWPPAWPTLEEVISEEKDEVKEAALKPMFEEWMVEYNRRYESEEEKMMRFREFKHTVKFADTRAGSAEMPGVERTH